MPRSTLSSPHMVLTALVPAPTSADRLSGQMSAQTSQRDSEPTAGGAGEAVVLVAPAQARGAALTSFAMQVRAAAVRGPVLIDDSACWSWSPGQRLVLERLRAFASRCSQRALVVAS